MKRRCHGVPVFFFIVAISLFGCGGKGGSTVVLGSSAAPTDTGVAGLADYYTVNDGSQFIRSSVPFTAPTGSGTVLQTKNADGSVTFAINNSPGYADCGFYLFIGMLGDLNSIKIATASGSDPVSVNIWFDRDNNAEFFTWSNNVYGGVGADAYILGPQASGNVLTINTGSNFTSLNPNGGSYSLAQLISGAAPGISVTTRIALWVGISVNSGNRKATIQSVAIN